MTETCAICRRIINKFMFKFNNVDINKIYFQDIEDDKSPTIAIYGVNSPQIKLLFEIYDVEVRYLIETNIRKWDLLTDPQKTWSLLGILGSNDKDTSGKIMKEDFKSYGFIVDLISQLNLDSDFMNSPSLPDILMSDIEIL